MKRKLSSFFLFFVLLAFQGCMVSTPSPGNKSPIPMSRANLETVFGENEGLEITKEDAKEIRDFYRGGVQQKAKAEEKFKEKAYPEALLLYQASDDFLDTLLRNHIDQDSASYNLFEGTNILFFPNLLLADNALKVGLILRTMGRGGQARDSWKQALSFVKASLRSESTEWGLALQKEILSLLQT
jgi:hypothetical protein